MELACRSTLGLSFLYLSWRDVDKTVFYVFQNLKQRYQGSCEDISHASIKPSNCGTYDLNT